MVCGKLAGWCAGAGRSGEKPSRFAPHCKHVAASKYFHRPTVMVFDGRADTASPICAGGDGAVSDIPDERGIAVDQE